MAWQVEFLGTTVSGANLVPSVRYTETVTGETFTEDFRANDITLAKVKNLCAQRLRQLEQRDRAAATFDGMAPGVFDPRA